MTLVATRVLEQQLDSGVLRALTAWLGIWPERGMLRVAPSVRRVVPGWDGAVRPLAGVASGDAVALSVPPRRFSAVAAVVDELAERGALRDRAELGARLPAALGLPHRRYDEAVLRWTDQPATLAEVGSWHRADDPRLPAWLRPFGPSVLAVVDADGRFLAGAGIKRHNRLAHEIAVGTAAPARGRGLARALVAQAARHVLADGALPLYLHAPDNAASARVAAAAGFADRGWRFLSLDDQ